MRNGVAQPRVDFFGRDGSLFLTFPYFKHSDGLLSVAKISAGQRTGTISLEPGGQCTSHLVKYSHHPDGRAHFSQTGKIRTEIVRSSVPLTGLEGHVFTLQAQGLHGFRAASRSEDRAAPSKRANLPFELAGPMPEAVKIIGHLYSVALLLASRLVGDVPDCVGPRITLRDPNGQVMDGRCIANPYDTSNQTCLLLACLPIPRFDLTRETAVIFLGGFDPPDVAADISRPSGFLACSHPVDNFDELRARLGSVDLPARQSEG